MATQMIIDALAHRNTLNAEILNNSIKAFNQLKKQIIAMIAELNPQLKHDNQLTYKENGAYEIQLNFGSEMLIFSLHSDIFNFDDNHFTHKLDYVKNDSSNSYCGIIKVYNFLTDSFKYNRNHDLGYLIARLFINKDNHYFVEGKRQLGFLYNDFENEILDEGAIKSIVESCVLYAIEFDLLVPPFDEVKEISVYQKIEQMGNAAMKTGKRLGFKFQADSDIVD